jgi:hypothetical protein
MIKNALWFGIAVYLITANYIIGYTTEYKLIMALCGINICVLIVHNSILLLGGTKINKPLVCATIALIVIVTNFVMVLAYENAKIIFLCSLNSLALLVYSIILIWPDKRK